MPTLGWLRLARRPLLILATAALLLATATAAITADESPSYDEKLLLRTLPGNSVLASFRFVSNGTSGPSHNHHSVFPRSLAQILDRTDASELHLRFALGRWDAEEWGEHIWDGEMAGGTGVELWAWVDAADSDGADKRWAALTNALSGLFCASLNFIDSTRTIRPVLSFQPSGHHSPAALERLHLLHGSLPREPVCTENLTPFLKLLPCKGKAGISSLLDGHKLFDAQWQSMSIDIAPVCTAPGQCHLQLVQTVDMVLDVDRSLALRDSPVPRPKSVDQLSCDPTKPYAQTTDGCFPQDDVSDLAWSLQELFGRPIRGHCPLAVSSSGAEQHEPVCADVPLERAIFITPGAKENKYVSGQRCFVLEQDTDFDIMVPEQTPPVARPFPEPPLYAERSFTGQGQERGGMQTVLRNPNPTDGVDFIYLESLPWSMKPYLHTLAVTLVSPSSASPPEKLIREVYYRPALDRHRGTQLEVALHVPANSTAVLTYDFEKAILRYTEYPPDANRGFDIAPAVITVLPPPGSGKRPFAIRTTSLLLYLPTPDFSMPYNVIILTSTVMALAFGNIFNILSRRFVAADEVPRRRAVENLRAKVLAVVAGVRRVLERRANRGAKAAKSE